MDGFAFVVLACGVAVLLVLLALGKYYPGSGAEQLDWKPTRSIETEVELELDDIDQMLEAQNERRRRRGERERTQEEIELEVAQGLRDQQALAAAYRAERADAQDLEEMLALANARRRRRGEPELTLEQLREELG
jgi:hypothetical protein